MAEFERVEQLLPRSVQVQFRTQITEHRTESIVNIILFSVFCAPSSVFFSYAKGTIPKIKRIGPIAGFLSRIK